MVGPKTCYKMYFKSQISCDILILISKYYVDLLITYLVKIKAFLYDLYDRK